MNIIKVSMLAVGLSLMAGLVMAQPPAPPNTTDLHAAYCIGVVQHEISLTKAYLPAMNASTAASTNLSKQARDARVKSQAAGQAALAAEDALLRKLQLYLLPRLMHIDPIGIVAAQQAAKDDVDRTDAAENACLPQCPTSIGMNVADFKKCMNECYVRTLPDYAALLKGYKACSALDWLPF